MRVHHNPKLMRHDFAAHPAMAGLLAEFDVRPHPRGRLHAKVLIFGTSRQLAHFYRHGMGIRTRFRGGADGVRGAVVQTGIECASRPPDPPSSLWVADRRYFCIIGLTRNGIGAEVVTHEAVHAAQCYVRRVKMNTYGPDGNPEPERIAYPAGRIAGGIVRHLLRLGL